MNPWQNADTRHFQIPTSDLGPPPSRASGNACFVNLSMILYFRGLELNPSSRVSLLDAFSIKLCQFTICKGFYNANFLVYSWLPYCKVKRLLFLILLKTLSIYLSHSDVDIHYTFQTILTKQLMQKIKWCGVYKCCEEVTQWTIRHLWRHNTFLF